MAERCKHGMDPRFCSLCNPKRTRAAPRRYTAGPAGTSSHSLESIVQFLNDAQVRATYGAVAELAGGIARGIGDRLTRLYSRSPEASWVVNADTGLPTGYHAHERHPALLSRTEIITNGNELERKMARWRNTR